MSTSIHHDIAGYYRLPALHSSLASTEILATSLRGDDKQLPRFSHTFGQLLLQAPADKQEKGLRPSNI